MAAATVHRITDGDRANRDRSHAENFRKLEGPIDDAKHMAGIANDLTMNALHKALNGGRIDEQDVERVIFATGHVLSMLCEMRRDYQSLYLGT